MLKNGLLRLSCGNATALFLLILISSVFGTGAPPALWAQTPPKEPDPIRLPPITVHVYKEPDDAQRLPVSVTGVPEKVLKSEGAEKVSDAAIYAPNTFFSEFTARKLSNARFRGISSSPMNPGITTYIDGVPQLNTNSSSIGLLDVEQVDFVRGPQSALFGRNTLGGLINITTQRPSLSKWTGSVMVPVGNYSSWDLRGSVSSGTVSARASRATMSRVTTWTLARPPMARLSSGGFPRANGRRG
jgi:outer membrane receptor protein involved in Fe transport